ncbi:hypothetical protein Vadar_002902 [Vaccinium darrowii]|uniref:Uncharacterized protein n=1 Tax=Vaccinium darrowii TaxID=229202 RepID=A0ACB7XW65_9ERIC|nr:hypothetical protein Vadar_002902 [Vaccinium darrowii]
MSTLCKRREEDEAILLSAEEIKIGKEKCKRSISGKIIANKGINLKGLKAAMEIAWGYPKGLKAAEVGASREWAKGPDEATRLELSGIGERPNCAPIEGALDGWLSVSGSCRHSWRTGGAVETRFEAGRRHEIWSLRSFWQFVNDLGAIDMGFSGYPFTWANRRYGDGLVKECLDKVLVSLNWKVKYDTTMVKQLFTVGSDCAALLLDTNPRKESLNLIADGAKTPKAMMW